MKLMDIISRAGRSLREAKVRTLLTSLAIGVGAFTITLSLAAGEGGRRYASDIISANTNKQELQVTQAQEKRNSGPQEYSDAPTFSIGAISLKQLSAADINKVAQTEGIKEVTPSYQLQVKYVTTGAKKYQASVQQFNASLSLNVIAGSTKGLGDNEIIMSKDYLDVLGFTSAHEAIGKTVSLVVARAADVQLPQDEKTFSYKVAAVTDKNELSFAGGNEFMVTIGSAKSLYDYAEAGTPNYGNFLAANAIAKDGVNVDDVKGRLQALGYDAQTAEDMMSTIFQFINVLQGILLGFGALAVLTSVFGIINTQYISVLERTQQIGLMKALGMRRRDVGRLFKLEAAWIGFLGGAIGSGLAIIAGTVANPWIADTLKLPAGTDLLMFQPVSVVVVIVGLMLVSVGAGILPARKAAKLDPIAALRTE